MQGSELVAVKKKLKQEGVQEARRLQKNMGVSSNIEIWIRSFIWLIFQYMV